MLVCKISVSEAGSETMSAIAEESAEKPFPGVLEQYLGGVFRAPVRVSAVENAPGLPVFLGRMYGLYDGRIAGERCVFLADLGGDATPARVAKHVGLVRAAVDGTVVFAARSLSAHSRARLMAQGIPFVVPGNQLYIPELAVDLRERFRAARQRQADRLSPAAQAVLFHHLLGGRNGGAAIPSCIAPLLHYSAMSVGRAFDELINAGLADSDRQGKERRIRFKAQGRELFESAQGLLRSPVRTSRFVQGGHATKALKQGGESALANLTNLSPPELDVFAVAAGNWKKLALACGFVETDRDRAECIVETWAYDPAGLSSASTVDPLSLYAQFRDHDDERVTIAAETLLQEITW